MRTILLAVGCFGAFTQIAHAQNSLLQRDTYAATRSSEAAWWLIFSDSALSAVVERALADNLTIEVAAARLDQATAAARLTRASLLPALSASGSAAALRQSLDDPQIRPFVAAPGFQRDVERYDVGLRASWELDLFGARPRQRSSRARAAAAENDVLAARIAISAEVASAYFSIVELRERLAIARDRADTLDQQLAALSLRAEQGVVARLEVDRFASEASGARAAAAVVEVLLAGEQARLGVLAGVDRPQQIAALVPTSVRLPELTGLNGPTHEYEITLASRPDVAAAFARLAASEADISVARSYKSPKLSLAGLLATIAGGPAALFSSSSVSGQGVAGLSFNLFDFGRIDAEISRAEGARREALAEYRLRLLQASSEVRTAGETLALRKAELRQRHAAETAITRGAETASATYQAGALDLTALLDVERSRLAASDATVIAKAEAARSLVGIFRAVGGAIDRTTPQSAD